MTVAIGKRNAASEKRFLPKPFFWIWVYVMLALVDSGQKMVKPNTPLCCAYSSPLAYLRSFIHLTAVQTYTYIYDNTLPIPQSNATKAELDCA